VSLSLWSTTLVLAKGEMAINGMRRPVANAVEYLNIASVPIAAALATVNQGSPAFSPHGRFRLHLVVAGRRRNCSLLVAWGWRKPGDPTRLFGVITKGERAGMCLAIVDVIEQRAAWSCKLALQGGHDRTVKDQ